MRALTSHIMRALYSAVPRRSSAVRYRDHPYAAVAPPCIDYAANEQLVRFDQGTQETTFRLFACPPQLIPSFFSCFHHCFALRQAHLYYKRMISWRELFSLAIPKRKCVHGVHALRAHKPYIRLTPSIY